jgi:hypothetical protein
LLVANSPEGKLCWNRGVVVTEANVVRRSESRSRERLFAARAERELVTKEVYVPIVANLIRVD